MTFGERLRNARKEKKISQKDFATLLNVRPSSVCEWENNKHKPDIDTIDSICSILNVTPGYLLGRNPTDTQSEILGKIMANSDMLEFIENYVSLDQLDQKAVKQLTSTLKERKN